MVARDILENEKDPAKLEEELIKSGVPKDEVKKIMDDIEAQRIIMNKKLYDEIQKAQNDK